LRLSTLHQKHALFTTRAYDWYIRRDPRNRSPLVQSARPEQPPQAVRRLKVSKVDPPRDSKLCIGRACPVGAKGLVKGPQAVDAGAPAKGGACLEDTPLLRRCAQSRGLRRPSASTLPAFARCASACSVWWCCALRRTVVTVGWNFAKVLQFNDFLQSPHACTADGSI
jgi:hypothetical protein